MCLTAISGVLVTTKPIKVYKLLTLVRVGETIDSCRFKSPYMAYDYFRGRKYTPKNIQIQYGGEVQKGFHSFLTKKRARQEMNLFFGDICMMEMEIPEDSLYVLGDDEDIVSSHIQFRPRYR